jgi:hypothetical protein
VQLNVEAGEWYQFKVASVNSIGEGALSAISPPFIAALVPEKPLLVVKVSSDETHIAISWQAPLNDNGSLVTSFDVYMDSVKVTGVETSETTWRQEAGIVTGFLHTFEVTATNGKGESNKSDPVQIYAAQISTAPVNLSKLSASATYVQITWSAPLSDGGTPILDYQVYWDEGKANDNFVELSSSTSN